MKQGRKLLALALALGLGISLMAEASAASDTLQEIETYLNHDITVTYNGDAQTLKDANGNTVYPITYSGTTYLPVRAVSNMLGLAVDWDQDTQTVLLSDSADGRTAQSAGGAEDTTSGLEEIKAYLNSGISVTYNGEAKTLADVNGNAIYPLVYDGTTYLPVRAVSNMLGIDVDWDGDTQTVVLSERESGGDTVYDSNAVTILNRNGSEVTVDRSDLDAARAALEREGYNQESIDAMLESLRDTFLGYKTSEDAEVLGEKHIGYDYAEIDWSTANGGYIRVKVNKEFAQYTTCSIGWVGEDGQTRSERYYLPSGRWINLPLYDGASEYTASISPLYTAEQIDQIKDAGEDQLSELWRDQLQARFTAEIADPDVVWTLSTVDIDYENAPLTCAKALEITKNCKTDAEKITAVYNWVAKNIKYDYNLADEIKAWNILSHSEENADGSIINPVYDRFQDGAREHLVLDDILTSKSGVCEDYATLMVGMLRSLGIPCKYVGGTVYTGEIIEGYSPDGWAPHAWVAVSPDTEGLNLSGLGAGHEEDGWIRLDPTWGGTSSGRAAAAVDQNHRATEQY